MPTDAAGDVQRCLDTGVLPAVVVDEDKDVLHGMAS
jgi:hypothetical protein